MDYESIEEEIVFDGNTFQELLCVDVSIFNDVFFEPVEQFSVTLISPSKNVVLDEGSASVTISIDSTTITNAGDKSIPY